MSTTLDEDLAVFDGMDFNPQCEVHPAVGKPAGDYPDWDCPEPAKWVVFKDPCPNNCSATAIACDEHKDALLGIVGRRVVCHRCRGVYTYRVRKVEAL